MKLINLLSKIQAIIVTAIIVVALDILNLLAFLLIIN